MYVHCCITVRKEKRVEKEEREKKRKRVGNKEREKKRKKSGEKRGTGIQGEGIRDIFIYSENYKSSGMMNTSANGMLNIRARKTSIII